MMSFWLLCARWSALRLCSADRLGRAWPSSARAPGCVDLGRVIGSGVVCGAREERETHSSLLLPNPTQPNPTQCKKSCPVVKVGKLCVEVAASSKVAWISEELCIGCGICVKVRERACWRSEAAAPSRRRPSR